MQVVGCLTLRPKNVWSVACKNSIRLREVVLRHSSISVCAAELKYFCSEDTAQCLMTNWAENAAPLTVHFTSAAGLEFGPLRCSSPQLNNDPNSFVFPTKRTAKRISTSTRYLCGLRCGYEPACWECGFESRYDQGYSSVV